MEHAYVCDFDCAPLLATVITKDFSQNTSVGDSDFFFVPRSCHVESVSSLSQHILPIEEAVVFRFVLSYLKIPLETCRDLSRALFSINT